MGGVWESGGLRLGTHHPLRRLRSPLPPSAVAPEVETPGLPSLPHPLGEGAEPGGDRPGGQEGRAGAQAGDGLPPKPGAQWTLPLPEPFSVQGEDSSFLLTSGLSWRDTAHVAHTSRKCPLQRGPITVSGRKREAKVRRCRRGPRAAQTLPADWADRAAIHVFMTVEWKQNR